MLGLTDVMAKKTGVFPFSWCWGPMRGDALWVGLVLLSLGRQLKFAGWMLSPSRLLHTFNRHFHFVMRHFTRLTFFRTLGLGREDFFPKIFFFLIIKVNIITIL